MVPLEQLVAHMSGVLSEESGSLDAKLKHLELIQGVIGRMSNSSFLFKGWAITIAAGLSAFAATSSQGALRFALIGAIVSSLLFWGLDGYYLWIEHRYVALYEKVARTEPGDIDFSMATDRTQPARNWVRTCRRPHLASFYGLIVVCEAVGLLLIRGK